MKPNALGSTDEPQFAQNLASSEISFPQTEHFTIIYSTFYNKFPIFKNAYSIYAFKVNDKYAFIKKYVIYF